MSAEDHNLMAVMYSAVTAVEEGKVGEIEIDHRTEEAGREVVLTISVRRDVKQYVLPPADGR